MASWVSNSQNIKESMTYRWHFQTHYAEARCTVKEKQKWGNQT